MYDFVPFSMKTKPPGAPRKLKQNKVFSAEIFADIPRVFNEEWNDDNDDDESQVDVYAQIYPYPYDKPMTLAELDLEPPQNVTMVRGGQYVSDISDFDALSEISDFDASSEISDFEMDYDEPMTIEELDLDDAPPPQYVTMFRGNRVGFVDTDDEDDMMSMDSSRMSLSELMTSGIHVIEDDE
jgi:hypothetical protein